MARMNIVKSKHINAPVTKVYETVSDFHHWPQWSPWLIMEPGVNVDIKENGKDYSWEGKRTGSGNMQVTQEKPNEYVDYDLNFLKPYKSHAKVKFEVSPDKGGTLVKWHMDSKLPFYLFWMKKSMETYIGMDYERGLALLKDYVEDGEVHSKLNFLGPERFEGSHYIGLRRKTTMNKVGMDMQEDFGRLDKIASKYNTDMTQIFCIYHKYNAVKDVVEYTAGVKTTEQPGQAPEGFTTGYLEPTRLYTLEHIGPYAHLGNAWSTLQTMIRNKEIKIKRGYHPFETYENSPENTDPNDLITRIHFALK